MATAPLRFPANEMDSRGNPLLWAHDIPIKAKGELAVKEGAIYYGALTRDRVYVRTSEKEFDFPQGQANAETVYQGRGGIPLSNFWRKLVVAHETDGLRLFISEYFTPESRVLLRRNIVERVESLAPFLTFDHDPYIVADGDHYSYIIDAYTSSANYPYSEAYRGSLRSLHGRNYLRNSVKAVVDAYNGSVTFYVFDYRDPIIKAYRQMLPGSVQGPQRDAAESPASCSLSRGFVHRPGRDVRYLPHDQSYDLLQPRGSVGGAARTLSRSRDRGQTLLRHRAASEGRESRSSC